MSSKKNSKKHIHRLKKNVKHELNPFENIEQQRRFNVLGHKNQRVSLSKARSRQIESRKETLLRDMYNVSRANKVVDERTLDIDGDGHAVDYVVEKMVPDSDERKLERARERALRRQNKVLAAERKRRQRGALFDLGDDDDDDGDSMGVFKEDSGGSLQSASRKSARQSGGAAAQNAIFGDREAFIDRELFAPASAGQMDDDNDDGLREEEQRDLQEWTQGALERRLKKEQKRRAKAQMPVERPVKSTRKTGKERLEEIIDKSRTAREIKMQIRGQMAMEMEELDEEFEEMKELLVQPKSKSKQVEKKNNKDKNNDKDEFDRVVEELSKDTPTTVVSKSGGELEQRERARLLSLEMERQKRLQQQEQEENDSSDEESEHDETDDDSSDEQKKSRIQKGTDVDNGDALHDGLEIDPEYYNYSDDEDISDNDDDDEASRMTRSKKTAANKGSSGHMTVTPATKELDDDSIPYVIRTPSDYDELRELLDGMTPKQVRVICNRIITVNSQADLCRFLDLLLEHFNQLGEDGPVAAGEDDTQFIPMMNTLSDCIQDLSLRVQPHAIKTFGKVIQFMQRNLIIHLDTVTSSSFTEGSPQAHGFPSSGLLFFLQLIGDVFPRSDVKHPYIAAALLLLHQIISHCPIRTMRDVLYGLFTCSIILDYTRESKRISPEVMHFLTALLATSIPEDEHSSMLVAVTQPSKMIAYTKQSWLSVNEHNADAKDIVRIDLVEHILKGKTDDAGLQVSALCATVDLLQKFTLLYAGAGAGTLPAVPELLQDALTVSKRLGEILAVSAKIQKATVVDMVKSLVSTLETSSKRISVHRTPLQTKAAKRASLFEFEPLIYNEDSGGYRGPIVDQDKQRLQKKILQRKVSRERRAAVRELRKDNAFLRTAREKVMAWEAQVRKERYKRALSIIQNDRTLNVQLDTSVHKINRMRKQMRKRRKGGDRA